jgi:serine/threonine protein phosphatase PrpC
MKVRILQLHKPDSVSYEFIQDKFAINLSNKTIAIADGTTQSFESEYWAESIASIFVDQPLFNPSELIELLKNTSIQFVKRKTNLSENPALASLQLEKKKKGSTSTLLGVGLEHNELKIISCGDSNLFICNDQSILQSIPFSHLNELDANKSFINNEQLISQRIQATSFYSNETILNPGNYFLLATDAVARLLLSVPSVFHEILNINHFDDLLSFSKKYWDSNELEKDDLTVAIVYPNQVDGIEIISPPPGFRFESNTRSISVKSNETTMKEDYKQIKSEIEKLYLAQQKSARLIKNQTILIIAFIIVSLLFPVSYFFSNSQFIQKQVKKIEQASITITPFFKSESKLEINDSTEVTEYDAQLINTKEEEGDTTELTKNTTDTTSTFRALEE